MDIAVWITFVIGIAAGGSIIYIRQRKLRMEELEKAAAMTEDILAGRKLRTTAPGDELLRRCWMAEEKRRKRAGMKSRN